MSSYEIEFIRSNEFHTYEEATSYQEAFKRVASKRKSKTPASSIVVKLSNMNYVVDALTLKENEHKHQSKNNQCTEEIADKILVRVSEAFS